MRTLEEMASQIQKAYLPRLSWQSVQKYAVRPPIVRLSKVLLHSGHVAPLRR